MKVRIKIFGTLQNLFTGYSLENGLEIELPQEATYGELIRRLGIPESSGAFAIEDGRVMKRTEEIRGKNEIRIMQPLHGG